LFFCPPRLLFSIILLFQPFLDWMDRPSLPFRPFPPNLYARLFLGGFVGFGGAGPPVFPHVQDGCPPTAPPTGVSLVSFFLLSGAKWDFSPFGPRWNSSPHVTCVAARCPPFFPPPLKQFLFLVARQSPPTPWISLPVHLSGLLD